VARGDPVRRTRREGYEIRLDARDRDVLRGLPDQLRELIEREDPSSDPAMARLYPPAYLDDPIRNLEFEGMAGDDLTKGRLAAIERMNGTVDAEQISEDDLLAWLSVTNDLRLVLGTRLDITEETTDADFPPEDPRAGAFGLYGYLTWLVDAIVRALSG
jgi:hypothetical protein